LVVSSFFTERGERIVAKKSDGVNVSETIRAYLHSHQDVGPTEAAADISKQVGKEIPASYVSNIKNLMKKKKGKSANGRKNRKLVRAKKAARATSGLGSHVARLESLKEIIQEVGAEDAHKLIDVLS
jgi:hypothetical protein